MSFTARAKCVALFSFAALLCFSSSLLSASTVVVTPPSTTPCKNVTVFNTFAAAISSVPAGSIIYVCPGNYPEQIVITKKLTIIGVASNGVSGSGASGANNPVITSPSGGVVQNTMELGGFPTAAQIVVQNVQSPDFVNISNLTVDGSNNMLGDCATDLVGIYYQNASGTLNHVATRFQELSPDLFGCQDGLAIFVQSGGSMTANVTIQNSSVHDYDKNGITADGSGTNVNIAGNYVVGIGATTLIAQNGVQVSRGAHGKITNNTVTDDVYTNAPDCASSNSCYSATGILLYESGGSSASHLTVSGNTVSNTQGAIVAFGDLGGNADYNDITLNKITTSPVAGPYFLDGIDLCSNNNTAKSNNVFNSSGAGIHIDSQCSEPSGSTGNNTTVMNNTINEACAGVMTGINGGNSVSGNLTYNVGQVTQPGDACPAAPPARAKGKLKPQPLRH